MYQIYCRPQEANTISFLRPDPVRCVKENKKPVAKRCRRTVGFRILCACAPHRKSSRRNASEVFLADVSYALRVHRACCASRPPDISTRRTAAVCRIVNFVVRQHGLPSNGAPSSTIDNLTHRNKRSVVGRVPYQFFDDRTPSIIISLFIRFPARFSTLLAIENTRTILSDEHISGVYVPFSYRSRPRTSENRTVFGVRCAQ